MSKGYDEYLRSHIDGVKKALMWMKENIPDVLLSGSRYEENIANHDISKCKPEEYDAYDIHFYGDGRPEKPNAFDLAWLHHVHNNPHHWQYWILFDNTDDMKVFAMPYDYVIEMVCDWWSFGINSGKPEEIFYWYNDHRDKMLLNGATRMQVEHILRRIRDVLAEDGVEIDPEKTYWIP